MLVIRSRDRNMLHAIQLRIYRRRELGNGAGYGATPWTGRSAEQVTYVPQPHFQPGARHCRTFDNQISIFRFGCSTLAGTV